MKKISNYFYEIAKNKLFKLNRSLTGKDTYKTIQIIKREIPKLKIKTFKSGTRVYDWNVPIEWNVNSAYVEDKYKKRIIDFKLNNLHLVGYSQPFEGFLNKIQLLDKINSLKKNKTAIPYVTSYFKKNWGFCTSETFKKKLEKNYKNKDLFKIKIDTKFNKKGKMHYGELVIKGKSDQEILISTYICHPSMANNELSGPIVSGIKINLKVLLFFVFIKYLIKLIETIGALAYINRNITKLKKNIISGFNLTCVGDEGGLSYIQSKYKNTLTEKIISKICKSKKINIKRYSFLERGSNERQFNSPGVDLPIITVCKSKFATFKEYHTSKDDFNLVTKKGIYQSFSFLVNLIKNIDKELIPKVTIIGEPFLQKRNMIDRSNHENQKYNYKGRDTLDVLQFCDGTNTVKEISKYTKINTKQISKVLIKLKELKIVSI